MCACCKLNSADEFLESLNYKRLSDEQRAIVMNNYVKHLRHIEKSKMRGAVFYHLFTNIITIGSLLLASIISLNGTAITSPIGERVLYWLSWSLALVVAICGKLLYTYNIPQHHTLNKIYIEKFASEGWQYLAGIGRYQNCDDNSGFALFISRVDRLRKKAIQEYTGTGNRDTTNPPASGSGSDLVMVRTKSGKTKEVDINSSRLKN